MSDPVTLDNIKHQISILFKLGQEVGLVREGEYLEMLEGSSTNRHSWALFLRERDDKSKMRAYPGVDLIGAYTKREAHNVLRAAINMLSAIYLLKFEG